MWLATGHTDMRKGFASLSLQVQEVLRRDPLSGHLFCFRGRRGDLLKVIWHGVLQSMKEVNNRISCVQLYERWRTALLHRRSRRRCKTTTLWLRLKGAVISKCCKSPGFTGQVGIQKASESESFR
ncbi:IS66 family insertion sequence element accessory protein TnpB [Bradyrhizobium elkanii]|uniref:IS66 family insertion sequence element accessory protein TnpB n=1 Tax=Bradyrhizobium elkanii TaxID=29448 RepID=UPI00192A7302